MEGEYFIFSVYMNQSTPTQLRVDYTPAPVGLEPDMFITCTHHPTF